jgi:hypothetical protein
MAKRARGGTETTTMQAKITKNQVLMAPVLGADWD